MSKRKSRYRGHRFPPQVISHAIWLYHRFSLSFRAIEELLAERGIEVSYETIRRWCLKFGLRYRMALNLWLVPVEQADLPGAEKYHGEVETAAEGMACCQSAACHPVR
jgi:hypothetical protein